VENVHYSDIAVLTVAHHNTIYFIYEKYYYSEKNIKVNISLPNKVNYKCYGDL